jgi:hypothetical protein
MASLSGYTSPPPSSLLPLFTPLNSLQPSRQLKQSRGFQFKQWLILYKCGYGKREVKESWLSNPSAPHMLQVLKSFPDPVISSLPEGNSDVSKCKPVS